jgi:hypothetical protein
LTESRRIHQKHMPQQMVPPKVIQKARLFSVMVKQVVQVSAATLYVQELPAAAAGNPFRCYQVTRTI